MQFKPNFDLLLDYTKTKKAEDFISNSAFVAVFTHNNKTLVYMCDLHRFNVSFNMVDMCFADDFGIKPDVLLVEKENDFEKTFGWYTLQSNSMAYAAAVADSNRVPVVFADLSDNQAINILQSGFPDVDITDNVFHDILRAGPGNSKMCEYLNKIGRDRFMLENIAAALNKYDTVFAIFGIGHYEAQRLVLEDMMGEPEYITQIKNMRNGLVDVKVNPIKLCDFKFKKYGGENGQK